MKGKILLLILYVDLKLICATEMNNLPVSPRTMCLYVTFYHHTLMEVEVRLIRIILRLIIYIYI